MQLLGSKYPYLKPLGVPSWDNYLIMKDELFTTNAFIGKTRILACTLESFCILLVVYLCFGTILFGRTVCVFGNLVLCIIPVRVMLKLMDYLGAWLGGITLILQYSIGHVGSFPVSTFSCFLFFNRTLWPCPLKKGLTIRF